MTDVALQHAEEQAPLEGVIKGEVLRMYQEVAEHPEGEFHFYHGRRAAEMFGYASDWLDRAPGGAACSPVRWCWTWAVAPGSTASSPRGRWDQRAGSAGWI